MCRLQSVIRYHLGANTMMLINRAGDYLTEQTGFGATSRYTAFGKVEQWLRRTAQQVAPDAESLDDGTIAKIYQGLGSAPAAIAEYATGTRYLGPVAGFAGVDALHAADQEPEDVALAAAKGALLGGAFKAAGLLKRPSRTGALATIGGTQAVAEGGDVSDDRLKELSYSARDRPLDLSRRHDFHERLCVLVYVRLYPRDEKRDEGV